ncbi:MAG: extracellular solute-binding protein [Clostridia bacterium]|nr:extracellular solute-binding protein [Clostridia bacterium]
MKRLLLIIIALTVAFGCVGCAKSKTKIDEEKTLRIWSAPPLGGDYSRLANAAELDYPSMYSQFYTKYVFEEFKKIYPDVNIAYEPMGWAESLNQKLMLSANSVQPDIVGMESYTQNLINMDFLSPVEWSGEVYNNFLPFTLESSMRDGKLYATPIYTNIFTFMYNENLMIEAGCPIEINEQGETELVVPATWAEVLYCCEKVNDHFKKNSDLYDDSYGAYVINNEKGIAAGLRGEFYLQSAGGSMIKEGALQKSITASEIDIDTEKNVDGFTLMDKLYKYAPYGAYVLGEGDVAAKILNGMVAMTVDIPAWLCNSMAAGVNIKTASVPVFTYDSEGKAMLEPYAYGVGNRDGVDNGTVKGKEANVAIGNVSFAITKKSTKKEMAQKFIEICLSDEAQAYLLGLYYRSPSTKSGLAYVLDDVKMQGLKTAIPEYGDYAYRQSSTVLKTLKNSIEDELRAVDGQIEVAGGVACFSKNIMSCWTYYETFMRKIYKDRADDAALRAGLKELSDSLKRDLK